jgi:hypothetical protein
MLSSSIATGSTHRLERGRARQSVVQATVEDGKSTTFATAMQILIL